MDHISKALEKAQSEKKSVRNWVNPQNTTSPPQSYPQATESVGTGKVVELDTDCMHRNFVLAGHALDDPIIADVYRLLRTRVLQGMRNRNWNKLGITSPEPKAGKTLNAVNLALAIAREGTYNVLLVDADIRKPSIADRLGLDVDCGIVDYLTGDAGLDEIMLKPDNMPNLTIIPGQAADEDKATPEVLSSDRVLDVFSAGIRRNSRSIVIVDLPPVLVGDDVLALAPRLDALIMVVREGSTDLQDLEQSVELLKDFNLMGSILNDSKERSKGFEGYYYHPQPA